MALVTWSPTLYVNVKQFDDQHMQLVKMINELHDAVKTGRGNEALGTTLNGLISYTCTHFSDEESLMISHDYPDAAAHEAEHAHLVKIVSELQLKFDSGHAILTFDVLMFLRDWLMGHILVVDKKFGVYLNGIGVS